MNDETQSEPNRSLEAVRRAFDIAVVHRRPARLDATGAADSGPGQVPQVRG